MRQFQWCNVWRKVNCLIKLWLNICMSKVYCNKPTPSSSGQNPGLLLTRQCAFWTCLPMESTPKFDEVTGLWKPQLQIEIWDFDEEIKKRRRKKQYKLYTYSFDIELQLIFSLWSPKFRKSCRCKWYYY